MSEKIKVYLMWGSQPSRAVLALLEYMSIPYEVQVMNFMDLKQDEFTEINPDQRVPCIVDPNTNITIFESHAILRYLVSKKQKEFNYLYPSDDALKRTRVDQYLDWHHQGTRSGARLIFSAVFAKQMKVEPPSRDIPELTRQTDKAYKFINDIFLKDDKFIFGFDQPTLADFSAYPEIIQLKLMNYDYSKFPRLEQWLKKMGEYPAIKASHVQFGKMVAKMDKQRQQQKPKL